MTGKFDFIEEDKRIIEQRLKKHQMSQQEHQKLLKNLPDEKDRTEEIQVYKDKEIFV